MQSSENIYFRLLRYQSAGLLKRLRDHNSFRKKFVETLEDPEFSLSWKNLQLAFISYSCCVVLSLLVVVLEKLFQRYEKMSIHENVGYKNVSR